MYEGILVSVIGGVLIAAIVGAAHMIGKAFTKSREAQEKAERERKETEEQAKREAAERRAREQETRRLEMEAINARIDALQKFDLSLGHDRIYAECMQHIAQGYMTTASLDNMGFLMRGYEGVGGDSTAHILWEKVKLLPIDDSKEPDIIRGSFDASTKERNLRWKEEGIFA